MSDLFVYVLITVVAIAPDKTANRDGGDPWRNPSGRHQVWLGRHKAIGAMPTIIAAASTRTRTASGGQRREIERRFKLHGRPAFHAAPRDATRAKDAAPADEATGGRDCGRDSARNACSPVGLKMRCSASRI